MCSNSQNWTRRSTIDSYMELAIKSAGSVPSRLIAVVSRPDKCAGAANVELNLKQSRRSDTPTKKEGGTRTLRQAPSGQPSAPSIGNESWLWSGGDPRPMSSAPLSRKPGGISLWPTPHWSAAEFAEACLTSTRTPLVENWIDSGIDPRQPAVCSH